MWSGSLYFGNFLGPTIAGFLVEAYGFSYTSVLYWAFYLVVLVLDCAVIVYYNCIVAAAGGGGKGKEKKDLYQRIE
jgi:MFS family permease